MKNYLIRTVGDNYYTILDKIRVDRFSTDVYLAENYMTKNIETILPNNIKNIVTEENYFITKYKINNKSIERFKNILYEIFKKINLDGYLKINDDTQILINNDLLNGIDEYYGFNFKIIFMDQYSKLYDTHINVLELYNLLLNYEMK